MGLYRLLADLVVFAHALYVGFVIVALLAILVGVVRWGWVRNFWFRFIHFLMIATVVFEALFGIVCPLTTIEGDLREKAGETVEAGTFIGRFAHDVLFYDAPEWVFTICYCIFGGIVLVTLILAPPRRPRRPAWLRRTVSGGSVRPRA